MIPVPKIIKKWRLTGRFGGSTYYQAEDGGLLIISADGSRFIHQILGVDMSKAFGSNALDPDLVTAPVADPEPPQPVQEPVQVTHNAPVQEPEPVNGELHRRARMLGQTVRFRGPQRRYQLFAPGTARVLQDGLLSYATAQGWVKVSDDDVISPGSVEPIDKVPVVPRSRYERVTAWGPTKGRNW
jgi:hypothetical protein